MSKYKITLGIKTVKAGLFTIQQPENGEVCVEIPSTLIVELIKVALPKARKILGKNVVITEVHTIKL